MKNNIIYSIPDEPKVGDIIAVNGKGVLSFMIKLFSIGISHTEIIAQNPRSGMLECFSADEHGARFKPIENVVRETEGEIYYLQLRSEVRARLDENKFGEMIANLDGVAYDYLHFAGVAIDDWHIDWLSIFPKIPGWVLKSLKSVFRNTETMAKVVCSGACAWALKAGLGLTYNASEEMPLNICQYNLYKISYDVLKGNDRGISNYNSENVL